MAQPISLDFDPGLPDGYGITLQLVLKPGEGLRLAAGGWADMTPEEIADYEQCLSEFTGEEVKLPRPDPRLP